MVYPLPLLSNLIEQGHTSEMVAKLGLVPIKMVVVGSWGGPDKIVRAFPNETISTHFLLCVGQTCNIKSDGLLVEPISLTKCKAKGVFNAGYSVTGT